jgi:hypothetical protein
MAYASAAISIRAGRGTISDLLDGADYRFIDTSKFGL